MATQNFRGLVRVERSARESVRDGKERAFVTRRLADATITVHLRVDVDALIQSMGKRADRSRNKTATAMGGALRATIPDHPR